MAQKYVSDEQKITMEKIKLLLKKWNGKLWIGLLWLRLGTRWQALVNAVMNLRVP
jgi:hypothetical protein